MGTASRLFTLSAYPDVLLKYAQEEDHDSGVKNEIGCHQCAHFYKRSPFMPDEFLD